MNIGEVIYFSRNYHMTDLDFKDEKLLLKAFIERVEEYYFIPAEKLSENHEAFSRGVLILSGIDFIGEFFIRTKNSHRIKEFCRGLNSVKEKDEKEIQNIVELINDHYRNGLIHEGRIKNLGQFSYDFKDLIIVKNGCSVINPSIFLKEVRSRFKEYIKLALESRNEMVGFKERLKLRFMPEIDALLNN